MNWVEGVVVYVLIWWVVIFAVLPFGAKPPDQVATGHASAPAKPRLWLKAGIVTVVSAVIWFAIHAVVQSDLISFRGS
jgi:predicted secreted protein